MPTPDDTRSLWGGEEDMGGLKELVVDLFVWYDWLSLLCVESRELLITGEGRRRTH